MSIGMHGCLFSLQTKETKKGSLMLALVTCCMHACVAYMHAGKREKERPYNFKSLAMFE